MGYQDGIDRPDIGPQHLLAEIGAAINNQALTAGFNRNRGTEPLVAWIGRLTNTAVASDYRNALGSPRTKKGNLHDLVFRAKITCMKQFIPNSFTWR